MNNKKRDIFFCGFVIIAFVVAIFACKAICDYGWHVKAGEYIVSNLQVPKTGIFSWFAKDLPWIAHEWLSEVILYGYRVVFGNHAQILFMITGASLLGLILFLTNRKNYYKNVILGTVFIVIGALTMTMFFLARPHMISYCLLALVVYLLFDLRKNPSSKKIYFIPLLSLIWVNVHGGSSNLPYLLVLIFLVSGLFQFRIGRIEAVRLTTEQLKRYGFVFLLSVLTCFINPNTYQLVIYPYVNMMDRTMLATIGEWASPDIKNFQDLTVIVMNFGFVLLIMLGSKKKIPLVHLILLLMFTYLSFSSVRFIPLFYIVSTYYIFDYVEEKKKHQTYQTYFLFLFIEAILLLGCVLFTYPSLHQRLNENEVSNKALSIIQEKNPKRLFNSYNLGSELIYRGIDVAIDGRADLYSKTSFKDIYDLENMLGDPKKLLKKYKFDLLLVIKDQPLAFYLANDSNYQEIYKDKNIVIFESKEKTVVD